MGRKMGSRSHDYDDKRAELARRVYRCLLAGEGGSLSAMAEFTGVSRPTLRHYFTDRDGAVRAAVELAAKVVGARFEPIAELDAPTARQALREGLEYFVTLWRDHGGGRLNRVGLATGLGDVRNGRSYLEHALEPALDAFETLIVRLQAQGKLGPGDPRTLSFAAVGPLQLALIHQLALGGAESHPVDLRTLIDEVAERLTGPRTEPPPPAGPSETAGS